MRMTLPIGNAKVGAYFGGNDGTKIGYASGYTGGNTVDPLQIKSPRIKAMKTASLMDWTIYLLNGANIVFAVMNVNLASMFGWIIATYWYWAYRNLLNKVLEFRYDLQIMRREAEGPPREARGQAVGP